MGEAHHGAPPVPDALIVGFFDPSARWPVPMVRATVFLPSVAPRWVPIDFVLDTGAALTALQPGDATLAVGIDPDRLAKPETGPQCATVHGFGGTSTCYVENAEYSFRHDDGSLRVFRDRLIIAQPAAANRDLPSVLGWNLLHHFRIELDWARRHVYLH